MTPKQIICVIAVAAAIYTAILMSFGLFGAAVIPVGIFVLKWSAILFGYFMIGFLPIRIIQALKANETRRQLYATQVEAEQKKQKDTLEKLKEKALEDRIEQEYLKREDDI